VKSFGDFEANAVRLSPEQLLAALQSGEYVAILQVRKNSATINHAICVIDARGSRILSVDYPELHQWRDVAGFGEFWDGEAILIRWDDDVKGHMVLTSALLGILLILIGTSRSARHERVGTRAGDQQFSAT
jgi:hypothetical protein